MYTRKPDPNSKSSRIRALPDLRPHEVAKIVKCSTNLVNVVRCHQARGRSRDRNFPQLQEEQRYANPNRNG